VGEANDPALRRDVNAFKTAFQEQLENYDLGFYEGIFIDVVFVDTPQAALNTVCNQADTFILTDAFTAISAERLCAAQAGMQVVKDGQSGQDFELILQRQVASSIPVLSGRTFCALALDDPFTFVYPALALQALGVDPFDDFTAIITGFEDDVAMVLALQGRYEPGQRPRCAGAALPAGRLDEIKAELLEREANNEEKGLTDTQAGTIISAEVEPNRRWRPIPYGILVFPPEKLMPAFLRELTISALTDIPKEDPSGRVALKRLVGLDPNDEEDALVALDAAAYAAFKAWLGRTGWDMGQP
jgi:hypothetical protein